MKKVTISKWWKRAMASVLTASIVLTGMFSGTVMFKSTQTVKAADVPILSAAEVTELFEETRTDLRDESIYSVLITRFYDGDTGNNVHCWDDAQANNPDSDPAWRGDFKGLIDKLDYIKALGFTAICVTPVAQNASGYDYHGEHPINLKEIDPRFESDGYTYEDFIKACHEKSMKVIQTVVINSTGNFGEENLNFIMEKVADTGNIQEDVRPTDKLLSKFNLASVEEYWLQAPVTQYQQRLSSLKSVGVAEGDIYHSDEWSNLNWEDYTLQVCQLAGDCVDLNTENPVVYNYLIDVFKNYIKMGVDAFVVSNVNAVSCLTYNKVLNQAVEEAAATTGKKIPIFGKQVSQSYMWSGDYLSISMPFYTWKDEKLENTYEWSDDDWQINFDSALKFTQDNSNIDNASVSDNSVLNGVTYHTPDYSKYSGMYAVDDPFYYSSINAANAFNKALFFDKYYNDATWNMTYIDDLDYAPDRRTTVYDWGTQNLSEILSLMFTFRGIPSVTYGAEVEFQKGMDIDIGPNAPLSTTRRAYFGEYLEGNVVATGFGEYGNVSGTVSDTLKSPVVQHIQGLNRLRQAIPALRKGQYTTSGDYVEGNMAFIRRYTDKNTDSFVCVTVSSGATFKNIPNGTYIDAVTGDVKTVTNGTFTVPSITTGDVRAYVRDSEITPAPGVVVPNTTYLSGGAGEIGPVEMEKVEPESIDVDKKDVTLIEGENTEVVATILPENATDKTVTWKSYDTDIVTVSNNGAIYAKGAGSTIVTATTANGIRKFVQVTVNGTGDSDSGNSLGFEVKENWVYFNKPSTWKSTVNIYGWDNNYEATIGQWPGSPLTNIADDIYGIEVPEGTQYIIFNDGINQTADLVLEGQYFDGNSFQWTEMPDMMPKGSILLEHKTLDGMILSSKYVFGDVGSAYTTEVGSFDGYILKTAPENATGTYGEEAITVSYIYREDISYSVKVDGTEVATVGKGETYTLGDATYGYYDGTNMHKSGADVTVNSDMEFTSVNNISVIVDQGASIRYVGLPGIRFKAAVKAPEELLNSDIITTGMLITANDMYIELGNSTLNLNSAYTKINVVNDGWFNNQIGVYCASVVNISESNYSRGFIAKAYATINYVDGTSTTIYSGISGERSIKGIATAIKNEGYPGIDSDYHAIIDTYAADR